ncbi:MAG: DUF4012 domain-containing protein [Collinsella intestinalis]
MGGQDAYQQGNLHQQQGRTYADGGSAYGGTQAAHRSAYSANGGPEPKRGKGKIIGLVVGIVILAVVAFGGTTGFFLYKDAKNLQAQAGTLMSEVSSMKDYLKNGEGEQLNATAGTVAEQIASMRDTVNGPAWTIASFIPVYGDDIKLVRGMMEQADILAQDAMLPACTQLEDFKLGNLLTDGAVNIEMLKGLITTIQDVEPVVVSSIDAIDALPEPHIGKIKSLMDKVTGPMASAKTVLSNINEIAPVLPQMLGDGGSRTYLLMAQQNAELRATGGLPGSIGPLIVENGKITVGEFVAGSTNFSTEANMHGDVTAEENALFSDRMATRITDTNFNLDFPRRTLCQRPIRGGYRSKGRRRDCHRPGVLQCCALSGRWTFWHQREWRQRRSLMLHDAYNMLSRANRPVLLRVAGLAFKQIMGNLGEVGFSNLSRRSAALPSTASSHGWKTPRGGAQDPPGVPRLKNDLASPNWAYWPTRPGPRSAGTSPATRTWTRKQEQRRHHLLPRDHHHDKQPHACRGRQAGRLHHGLPPQQEEPCGHVHTVPGRTRRRLHLEHLHRGRRLLSPAFHRDAVQPVDLLHRKPRSGGR